MPFSCHVGVVAGVFQKGCHSYHVVAQHTLIIRVPTLFWCQHFGNPRNSPDTPKGTVAHLRPPADSVARADETATPAWVVFPRYEAGVKAQLTDVPRAKALLRTADASFNYSTRGADGFETLADLISTCGCHALHYSDLDEAVELIDRLTARRASGVHEEAGENAPEHAGLRS